MLIMLNWLQFVRLDRNKNFGDGEKIFDDKKAEKVQSTGETLIGRYGMKKW